MPRGPRYQVFGVSDDEKPWAIRDTKSKDRIVQRFRVLKNALTEAERLNKKWKRKK